MEVGKEKLLHRLIRQVILFILFLNFFKTNKFVLNPLAATPKFKFLKQKRSHSFITFTSISRRNQNHSPAMISESEASPRKNDVKDRRLSIIDFLSADDSLLDYVSPNHQQNSGQIYIHFFNFFISYFQIKRNLIQ
jgi:hypothetical protein